MVKIFFYLSALTIFLIGSKTLGPDNASIEYIRRGKDLNRIIERFPSEAILTETLSKGFLIKTYYQRYKIINPYQYPISRIFRARRSLAENNKKFKNMSVFRKSGPNSFETLPMPPGTLFVGNSQFGSWRRKNGQQQWTFYRAYRHLPKSFEWKNFIATRSFYSKIQKHKKKGLPYTGNELKKEKKEDLATKQSKEVSSTTQIKRLLAQYFKSNYN